MCVYDWKHEEEGKGQRDTSQTDGQGKERERIKRRWRERKMEKYGGKTMMVVGEGK